MTALLAWLWVPVLVYVVLLGVGLLADRLVAADLPAPLLAPVGLGVATVLLVIAYRVAHPLAAAGLVYALYMAPIVLSGEATWAGYNFVNDTATDFVLADLLAHHGFNPPAEVSGTAATATAFLNLGYPMGHLRSWAGSSHSRASLPTSEAKRLCGKPWDCIELVARPR